MLAPIILFVYNRPEHTKKTLESLEKNDLAKESELFIFADGPKESASGEQLQKIGETREIIKEKKWCGKVNIVEREKNMGLANSVIAGVTEIINKFGKVIVLEDDLVLSKYFLQYMNDGLDKFENEEKIMQISGYMFPVYFKDLKTDAFFLPFIGSWGWATWKRVWDNFDESAQKVEALTKDKKLRKKFDLNNSYPYFRMLLAQKRGEVDSWAIRFYLSVFMNDGLVLYPKKTLVNNTGFDGSGIHCSKGSVIQGLLNEFGKVEKYSSPEIIPETRDAVFKYLKRESGIYKKIINKLKYFLKWEQ